MAEKQFKPTCIIVFIITILSSLPFLISGCKPKSEPFIESCIYTLVGPKQCDSIPIEDYTMTQVASIGPSCILFRFYDPEHHAHYLCKNIKDLAPDPITISYHLEEDK